MSFLISLDPNSILQTYFPLLFPVLFNLPCFPHLYHFLFSVLCDYVIVEANGTVPSVSPLGVCVCLAGFACTYICTYLLGLQRDQKRTLDSLELIDKWCELSRGQWKLSPGPLEEQQCCYRAIPPSCTSSPKCPFPAVFRVSFLMVCFVSILRCWRLNPHVVNKTVYWWATPFPALMHSVSTSHGKW